MTEFTYAASGVDIDAGERAVTLMKAAVEKTNRPEVVGGLGGFAGLFALVVALAVTPGGRAFFGVLAVRWDDVWAWIEGLFR